MLKALMLVCLAALMFGGGTGCIATAMSHHPNKVMKVEEMRQYRLGACASAVPAESLVSSTTVYACLQTGAPGTLSDSVQPMVYATFMADDFGTANPGSWQIEIWDPSGALIVKRRFESSVPSVGYCTQYGCTKHGLGGFPVATAWQKGRYTIRMTLAFDTSIQSVMSITLL